MRNLLLLSAITIASTTALANQSFDSVDANSDGKISKSEYNRHVYDVGLYNDWDTDDDGTINQAEYNELGFNDDYYDWDIDDNEYLDSNELYEGAWSYYDEDENGHWDGDEWDDAGDEGFWDI